MNDDDIFAPWSEPAPPPSKQVGQTAPCYDTLEPAQIKAMLTSALFDIALNEQNSPSVRIQAANAVMDRDFGRAAQSITVDTKATVTHEHVMKLAPAEAYRLLIEGDKALTGLPVLDAEPVRGGGDTRELAAGDVVGEAPPQNIPPWRTL